MLFDLLKFNQTIKNNSEINRKHGIWKKRNKEEFEGK